MSAVRIGSEKTCHINRRRLTGGARVVRTNGCKRGSHDFLERDRRFAAGSYHPGECLPLAQMAFVLAEARSRDLLASMADQFQPPKVLQHCHSPAAERFYSFFRVGAVAIRQIADRSLRSVAKLQRDDNVVAGILAGIA